MQQRQRRVMAEARRSGSWNHNIRMTNLSSPVPRCRTPQSSFVITVFENGQSRAAWCTSPVMRRCPVLRWRATNHTFRRTLTIPWEIWGNSKNPIQL
jgi:hypothetical protein